MAEIQETSHKSPIMKENKVQECKTPPSKIPNILDSEISVTINFEENVTPPPPHPMSQPNNSSSKIISGINSGKTGTPDRLKVPKAFKFAERYTSPTDLMMSPITKGLLARSKKTSVLLPPTKTPHKVHSFKIQEIGVSR
ncbi:hypothetical protein Leryth_021126 [Lithospermum erythrorhizon]|nr:hypothetical protein Leryth_021126 [Lithospermum erythrorhizon]